METRIGLFQVYEKSSGLVQFWFFQLSSHFFTLYWIFEQGKSFEPLFIPSFCKAIEMSTAMAIVWPVFKCVFNGGITETRLCSEFIASNGSILHFRWDERKLIVHVLFSTGIDYIFLRESCSDATVSIAIAAFVCCPLHQFILLLPSLCFRVFEYLESVVLQTKYMI